MRRRCALCFNLLFAGNSISPYLCLACYKNFRPPTSNFSRGTSLFLYESDLRQLILRTKVQGDQHALACLVDLFIHAEAVRQEAQWAKQVVAAPSSLWGRARGRIDLAWFLAKEFATTYPLTLVNAPFSLHWRVFKRAQKQRHTAHDLLFQHPNASIPTLIIDDIITTGYTLSSVAQKLPGTSCRFLTLGDAFIRKKPAKTSAPWGAAP